MGKGVRAAVTIFPHESWESHVGLKHFLQRLSGPALNVLGFSRLECPVPCASQRGDAFPARQSRVPSPGRGTLHCSPPSPQTASVPVENPPASLVIGREDFQRIQEAARVLSKQEREARVAALKAEKEAVLVGISPPAPSLLLLLSEVAAPRQSHPGQSHRPGLSPELGAAPQPPGSHILLCPSLLQRVPCSP